MITEKMRNDITELQACINALILRQDSYTLNELKNAINTLFRTDGCKQVIYTQNTDKMFFGVCLMPVIPAKNIIGIIQNDDKYIVQEYYLELDSKLFDALLGLVPEEICAIIIREISHMITDATPMEKVKNDIDNYLLKQGETIKLTDSIHYIEILSYGIRDALRKVTSIFEVEEIDIIDQFDKDCGLEDLLNSAMSKISSNSYNYNKDIDNKIIFLSWVLRLYKDVLHNRIAAMASLSRGIQMTGSQLEKKEMSNIIRRLERIDDDVLLTEGVLDDILGYFRTNAKRMRANGIRDYEDDYYEIEFQVNNMETPDDATLLLHKINSRMAVIDDYLTSEELDRSTYTHWAELRSKYNELRGRIAKNKMYANKTRLYVNYGYND